VSRSRLVGSAAGHQPQVISVATSTAVSLGSGYWAGVLAAAYIPVAPIKRGSLRRCLTDLANPLSRGSGRPCPEGYSQGLPRSVVPSVARSREAGRGEPFAWALYETFPEGFATADLLEARGVLDSRF
jgi:hypothetical protein